MFNDRKLAGTGHGFVKAYSNNWLSQLGAVYKYESPKDVLRKPNHQHRKIAIYSILAMAFVAFFTLFMIVHEAERKSRQILIDSSFTNETAIEPSAGGYNTILTTPLSSERSSSGNNTSQEGDETTSMKRTRRLRYYGAEQKPTTRRTTTTTRPTTRTTPRVVTTTKCPLSEQNPDGSCGYDYPKPDNSFTLPNRVSTTTTTTQRPTTTTTRRTTTTTRSTTTRRTTPPQEYLPPSTTTTRRTTTTTRPTTTTTTTTTTPRPTTTTVKGCSDAELNPDGTCGYDYPKPPNPLTLPPKIPPTVRTTPAPEYLPPEETTGYSYPKPAIPFNF
ncbi:salivary glue protein Sgs-3-like [Anopheles maculipalpis]|uniref:salivary glue protein Sgs-3-like n=1 Tax=Anopheles maculipalpis TaxID=1496333 RepID=UPI00215980CF|nr:salivary glue protein Sgs-3-like [Anopheles maculipalpis]